MIDAARNRKCHHVYLSFLCASFPPRQEKEQRPGSIAAATLVFPPTPGPESLHPTTRGSVSHTESLPLTVRNVNHRSCAAAPPPSRRPTAPSPPAVCLAPPPRCRSRSWDGTIGSALTGMGSDVTTYPAAGSLLLYPFPPLHVTSFRPLDPIRARLLACVLTRGQCIPVWLRVERLGSVCPGDRGAGLVPA